MGKEIERKWLWNYEKFDWGETLDELGLPYLIIKDYYFNPFSRLRCIIGDNNKGLWFVTVKSDGTLVRDEFEVKVDMSSVDFIPTPMLVKDRLFYDYEDKTFYINVFKDITYQPGAPLITIEYEFDANDPKPKLLKRELPKFCGKEITEDKSFYGANLFKGLQCAMAEEAPVKKHSADNVIDFKSVLDKRK